MHRRLDLASAGAIAILLILAGCFLRSRPPEPPAQEEAADTDAATGRVVLDPRAWVRARLANDSIVIGQVLVRFTLDSPRLVVCDSVHVPCTGATDPSARVLDVADISALAVRGRSQGAGGYAGAMLGAGLGSLFESDNGSGFGPALGMFAGMLLGSRLGSRVVSWVPIFPCYHGCAAGVYPERPRDGGG